MGLKEDYNKKLVEEYPFLWPRNWFGKKIPEDKYDYSFTVMDEMEPGWVAAFGDDFLKELKAALIKNNALETYEVMQVKEKFARLCWYDGCYYSDVRDVVDKYCDISKRICGKCGKPATKISQGWLYPFCDECASETKNTDFVSIEDFYKPLNGGGET